MSIMQQITKAFIFCVVFFVILKMEAQVTAKTYRKIPLAELRDSLFHCTIIKGQVYLDGDIYLGDTTALNDFQTRVTGFSVAIDGPNTRWPNSTAPIEIDGNFSRDEKNQIMQALNEIMAATNFAFKLRTNERDYIFYKKVTEAELGYSGGRSAVGRRGNKQEILLSALRKGTIKHETMHSMGFYHEQSREDRDRFIDILLGNIELGQVGNFFPHNFDATDIGDYDFNSIMHYKYNAFGIKDNGVRRRTIRRRDGTEDTTFGSNNLSSGDIIAVNRLYRQRASPRTPLPVLYQLFSGNEEWSSSTYFGTKGTFIADVTGDGKADAIAVGRSYTTIRRSNGTDFSPSEKWTVSSFFGNKDTHFADVNGDGSADAIATSVQGTMVSISNGRNYFNSPVRWITGLFQGTKGVFFADVTGDRKADAIAVYANSPIIVRPSTGTGFGAPQTWTDIQYFGSKGTYFADVTGDGKADAIVVNGNGVTVRRSNGSSFLPNETWTNNPYFGSRGNFFADVTGDGKADAIVVNESGVTFRRSTGNGFNLNEDGTLGPYLADKVFLFADIKGTGKCAAIVVNNDGIVARPAQ